MKITPNQKPPPPPAPAIPVLRRKNPSHRKQSRRNPAARTPRFQSGKRAGPPTPLPQWKFDNVAAAGGERLEAEVDEFAGRRVRRGANAGGGTVSVRKLAAALWRLQPPEAGQERRRSSKGGDRLGFKRGTSHVGEHVSSYDRIRGFGFEPKGQPRSPCSVNGSVNGYTCEPQASFRLSNYAMEGATKWDPVRPEKNEDPESFQLLDNKQNAVPKVSALQAELEQAQRRIEELESERRSSKKKLKQFLLKLNEERTGWRSREHEKVRDVKADLTRERKNCQRLEMMNSKLVNDVAETKSVMKRYMQEFEKERKNRELVEEVCDELAKEMEEDKAEVEELKAECVKIREEVDDERKMLQMAEVWREERVQMKLVDAKVSLENKYSEMNNLVEYLQRFLGSNGGDLVTKEAELLHRAFSSVKIEEFTYVPPKSDDIFAIFEEMGMGETSEREIEPCKLDEDRSGWETGDDHGSSVSPEGSVTSTKKAVQRDSDVSGSGTETSEVCSLNLKKRSSISRLWRSLPDNGDGYKIVSVDGSNGRLWSSPESGNHPHIGKGMKGCIEWPRGQKQSFKSKLLESQKIQLRQVLKQKI